MSNWLSEEGSPIPLGVNWIEEDRAFNFALYSKHAHRVTLLVYAEENLAEPSFTYELEHLKNKSGRIWHCRIPASELNGARYYAWSVDGPDENGYPMFHTFDRNKILLDPYSKGVQFPESFNREVAMKPGSTSGKAPLGVLVSEHTNFDWSGDRRIRHESDLIIYEMHIKGFTGNPNSSVAANKRGTFAGVIEKIPYLKRLGITAVELMPVFQFDPGEGNYWGYMTLNFFAPHHEYCSATDPLERPDDFRTMVKALHAAEIEVILDVVYNHTAEGNHLGPTLSFRGIDNASYYRLVPGKSRFYMDYTGCGNTLN
ncbi:MAG: glycogen-debranching protein, partial [Planctomycetaceae bacterium]|nr:glycogen-debranching protein [Planctomycetaceae bacterium]